MAGPAEILASREQGHYQVRKASKAYFAPIADLVGQENDPKVIISSKRSYNFQALGPAETQ
jgi:hypothetical protein